MGIALPGEELQPLLYALEAAIHRYYRANSRLRDTEVVAALHLVQRTVRAPRGGPQGTGLAAELLSALEEFSGEYGPNDRARALRFLVASAKRHRRVDGARGYLDFLTIYAPLRIEPDEE